MPNYTYRCKDCEIEFEYFQGINDEHLQECEECGGELIRLLGKGSGIKFNGTGFYETDYKGK